MGAEYYQVKIRVSEREKRIRSELNDKIGVMLAQRMKWSEIASHFDVPLSSIHSLYTYNSIPTKSTYRKKLGFPRLGARRYYTK